MCGADTLVRRLLTLVLVREKSRLNAADKSVRPTRPGAGCPTRPLYRAHIFDWPYRNFYLTPAPYQLS